jgi:hypothetical protein
MAENPPPMLSSESKIRGLYQKEIKNQRAKIKIKQSRRKSFIYVAKIRTQNKDL